MRVFVTGASGWVGSAVVPELLAHGHEVVGLARSPESATAIEAMGAAAHEGALDDLDALQAGASANDAVIHLAFVHDFSQYEASIGIDQRAIAAIGDALAGTGRPFLIASGVATAANGRASTEDDPADPNFPRSAASDQTLALADRGVRSAVVRLPPTVHGRGDGGFVPRLIEVARERGVSGYVGEGANRWPAVHRLDAARLFRLGLEQAAPATVLHAIGDEGVPARTIAEVIGRHLDVPTTSIAAEAAFDHFGWIGGFFAADLPTSGALTCERFGWEPTEPGLVEDLEQGHYFEAVGSESSDSLA